MKFVALYFLFLELSSAHEYEVNRPSYLNCNCGWKNREEQITFPWVVALIQKDTNIFLCAGTILTQRHVLSSAVCVKNMKPNEMYVCLGRTKASTCGVYGDRQDVKSIKIESGYDLIRYKNDISLIKTVNMIVFNKEVGPACFPHENIPNEKLIGTSLIFLGWGGSEQLKEMEFKAKKLDECKVQFPLIQTDEHICVASNSGRNVKGDAGGTFVTKYDHMDRYIVLGVFARLSTNSNDPISIVTNVSAFRRWIRKKVYWTRHVHLCKKIL